MKPWRGTDWLRTEILTGFFLKETGFVRHSSKFALYLAGAVVAACLAVPAYALSEQYETPLEQDPAAVLDGK